MPDSDDLERRLVDRLATEAAAVRSRPGLARDARIRARRRRSRVTMACSVLAVGALVAATGAITLHRHDAPSTAAPRPVSSLPAAAEPGGWTAGRCAVTRVEIRQGSRRWDLLDTSGRRVAVDLDDAPATLSITGPCADAVEVFSTFAAVLTTSRRTESTLNGSRGLVQGPLEVHPGRTRIDMDYAVCAAISSFRGRSQCRGGPDSATAEVTVAGRDDGRDACGGTLVALRQDGRIHILYQHPGPVRPDIVAHVNLTSREPVHLIERGPCARQTAVRRPPAENSRGPAAPRLGRGIYTFPRGRSSLSLQTPSLCAFDTTARICEGGPGVILRFRLVVR